MPDPVVIVAARRTPIGAFQGQLSALSAPQLGSAAIRAAVEDAGMPASAIDEAVLGCCLMAGLKQAPARQAVLAAGLPQSVPATTINKICGSGMKAITLIHDMLQAGSCKVGLAGGMESMSNAPYLLSHARSGYRLGHAQTFDHMFLDGLEDAYEGRLMGHYADVSAAEHAIVRARQDAYAIESVLRARKAVASGAFRAEIVPVPVHSGHGETTALDDETPGRCKPDKIAELRAAFRENGTVTPGNSSSISDGAAALILMPAAEAARCSIAPLARIHAHASYAGAPDQFTTAPAAAIRAVLNKAGWSAASVDLFEINEAFAVVALLAIDELGLDEQKVNVHGGACALGHPLGATGARIVVTLIHALRQRGLRRGIATLCIGGGEASALALELV